MEFLVHIEIDWPPDADPQRREELFDAELARGRQLAEHGVMRRLWRVPGRWANWGLWEAEDATALHTALSSLPLWPWMDITVHALARHANDPADMDLVPVRSRTGRSGDSHAGGGAYDGTGEAADGG